MAISLVLYKTYHLSEFFAIVMILVIFIFYDNLPEHPVLSSANL